MRIVLDTNCLIQSIGRHSPFHDVWLSILSGGNTLCASNEILSEYDEVLRRFFSPGFADTVVEAIVRNTHVVLLTPHYHFNLIQADPDDNKFVDCAIQANARYIVTNDHHYDVLREINFPRVEVIALSEFVQLLKEQ